MKANYILCELCAGLVVKNTIFKQALILFIFLLADDFTYLMAQAPGDNLFNSSQVHYVNISFPQNDYWQQLSDNYEQTRDKDTNIYIVADIIIDSIKLDSIGIRLKGNSTYEHTGLKKPVKLSFDEFQQGRTFDRLRQLNLHNGYFDPSMMREKLMLDFLNEQQIPAPRCTYAEVHYNGKYIGLFKMVEEIDKRFLKSHFGNKDGNLFKGDPDGTLEWKGSSSADYYASYELKTNETQNNWGDLLHFIDVLNNSDLADFKLKTDQVFNASPFIKAWGANNLFGNLDSYFYLPHNYYLYHNEATGKFEWITWDVSVSFGVFPFHKEKKMENFDILYLPARRHKHPLTYNMLETEDYRQEYLNSICSFLYDGFTEEKLFRKIDSLALKIRRFIEKEPTYNQQYSVADFDQNTGWTAYSKWYYEVPGLKSFISERRKYVINRLCELKWSCEKGGTIKDSLDRIIQVYPNPAEEFITVDINLVEKGSRNLDYKIVTLSGEIVFSDSATAAENHYSCRLSTGALVSGIYVLSAISGCESYNKKIVVIRKE